MSKKYGEIMPPSERLPARRPGNDVTNVSPPRVDPGGLVSSTMMRLEATRHARTLGALTERTRAQSTLFDAQTQACEAYLKRQHAAFRLQELPEVLAADQACRRAQRAEELRALQHQHELAESKRTTEIAHAERVLVDAQQALKAQRDYGYLSHEIAWKRQNCELLDVELSTAERRAMLRQHIAELDQTDPSSRNGFDPTVSDDAVDDALYEARSQLRANGLDTGRIDAVIQARRGSGLR